jgi:hypothetical protein
MSEQGIQDADELGRPATNGELVHWMAPKPLRVGPAGVSAWAAGAFGVGVVATVVVLAFAHWLGPERGLGALSRRRRRM